MDDFEPYFYRKDRFRDREGQLHLVEALVSDRIKNRSSSRALVFAGPRGSGKSWLALHLARDHFSDRSETVTPFLVRLWPESDNEQPQEGEWWLSREHFDARNTSEDLTIQLVESIVDRLCQRIGLTGIEHLDLADRVHNLSQSIADWPTQRVLLLVVDSAFEGPARDYKYKDLLNTFQDALVTPLLRSARVVVVVTGRGAPPAWSSPYLRDAQLQTLPGLPEDLTHQILSEFSSPHEKNWQEIFNMTGGAPLAVRLAAQSKQERISEVLEEIIQGLLSIFPPHLHDILARFSLLDRPFRANEVVYYMGDLGPEIKTNSEAYLQAEQKVRQELEMLATAAIIEWKRTPSESGYMIDASLATLLRYQLENYKKETYHAFCLQAAAQFNTLATQFTHIPAVATYYRQRTAEFEAKAHL